MTPSLRHHAALLAGAVLLSACAGEPRAADASAASEAPAATVASAGPVASSAATAPEAAPVAGATAAAPGGSPEMIVYKSPTCGCCVAWVDHLREHGFTVVERDTIDMDAVKRRHGVHASHESCHTGIVDGYVIEGHVPADLVARLLSERPEGVAGLAVPGMPVGSPGMEMGDRKDPYDVLAFRKDGRSTVFAKR